MNCRKIIFDSLIKLQIKRSHSTAVAKREEVLSSSLSSELFEHIRHQVYGDDKKIEKLVVNVNVDDQESKAVLANRNISTPFNCFNHVSKLFADNAALAEVIPTVGGAYFSSVNQPVQDQASIRKISYDDSDYTQLINSTYWRSCNVLAGAILKDSIDLNLNIQFKDDSEVSDGYFSLLVNGLDGNALSKEELNTINLFAKKYISEEKMFESIHLPASVSEENGISFTNLVRINNHVFGVNGPVIGSTRQVGRFKIVYSKGNDSDVVVCGVSLPKSQPTTSYSWGLIVKNAAYKFNH